MKNEITVGIAVILLFFTQTVMAGFTRKDFSAETKKCVECHRDTTPAAVQQWGSSKHYRGKIGCYECHKAESTDKDAFVHEGRTIAIIVSPKDCSRCHEKEVKEFASSHHSKAGRIMGSLDNRLAEVVEGK